MSVQNPPKKFSRADIILSVLALTIIAVLASLLVYDYRQQKYLRSPSLIKAVWGNLKILTNSMSQFMGDKGRTQATYWDVVGAGTDKYVRTVNSVAGEDYTAIVVVSTQTQVSVSSASLGTVTWNL